MTMGFERIEFAIGMVALFGYLYWQIWKEEEKMKNKLMVILVLFAFLFAVSGCSQADRVSYNVSKEADNFNVMRRLTVINARSDKPLMEIVGRFSLSSNEEGELQVIMQTGPESYKKHFVYINKEWTMYVVEDISGSTVDSYKYEINFLPEMIAPVKFTSND